MKIKKLGALLVSAVLCAGMAAPAFAFEGEAAPVEQPVLPEVVEDIVTVTDETSGALTPEGNLTLVDDYHTNYSDGSGQQFITLVSKSGSTFYLVIDRNAKGQQTVHFMNLVDEADLLALMEEDAADAYTAEKEAAAQAEQDMQQVINGSKVTDHHALLPTKSMANADLAALPAGERNVLRLIAARLLCAVGEPHRYAETTLTTICAGEEFSAKGKVVLSKGWKAVERKMLGELLGKQKEPAVLPDVQEQSQCSVAGAELKEGQTSPPKPYTEAGTARLRNQTRKAHFGQRCPTKTLYPVSDTGRRIQRR